ncbi:MAG: phosphodiester glycosidase family protein [Gemmatimonadaceae bacterium]|nr:phosphodiester glycosidase family protein [Gemmatimonadaceae bacterium]
MTRSRRRALPAALVLWLAAAGSTAPPHAGADGGAALAVARGGAWYTWWRAANAPARWAAPDPTVTRAVGWHRAADGVEWGELRLAGGGEAWRTRVIVVRFDPARVRVRLDTAFHGSLARAAWTIARAPRDAVLALNAGQFVGSLPWGWVVLDGRELLPPGHGPLSTAVVIDTAGRFRWVQPGEIAAIRHRRDVAAAFQSYPTLLVGDGEVPPVLRARSSSADIDLAHRDARLAIGELRDGRVLIALTRFDALGGALDVAPFGLTTPEMAALMGALGCRTAVMLDGGISSQLAVRGEDGAEHVWPGLRRVPLGLVAFPRHLR